jgi:phage terminase Nu1 subunit (DNA packaging protein)
VTPPSTLRLGGIAATLVALVLMRANGPAPGRARPEHEPTQVAYAFTHLADAQAALAAVHQAQHQAGHKLAYARAVAVSYDSASAVVRVSPVPAVKAAAKR